MDIKKLKTAQNYAIKHNISRVQVYRLMKQGKIKYVKIDGKYFVYDK